MLTCQHTHDALQSTVVRQCMQGFEVKYPLVDAFESRIWIATRGVRIGDVVV
jgi:hypothetical protein